MSPKQKSFARFVESRYGENWRKLDENTRLALKVAWFSGWAAQQYWRKK